MLRRHLRRMPHQQQPLVQRHKTIPVSIRRRPRIIIVPRNTLSRTTATLPNPSGRLYFNSDDCFLDLAPQVRPFAVHVVALNAVRLQHVSRKKLTRAACSSVRSGHRSCPPQLLTVARNYTKLPQQVHIHLSRLLFSFQLRRITLALSQSTTQRLHVKSLRLHHCQ